MATKPSEIAVGIVEESIKAIRAAHEKPGDLEQSSEELVCALLSIVDTHLHAMDRKMAEALVNDTNEYPNSINDYYHTAASALSYVYRSIGYSENEENMLAAIEVLAAAIPRAREEVGE